MEKQIKTNDYETGRRLNTSDSKDESISKARDDEKKATQTNLLIISKIFDTIKPKKLSKKCFYAYLYGIDCANFNLSDTKSKISRAANSFNNLISEGEGDISQIAQILSKYGISEKYFNGNYFEADDIVIDAFSEYCTDSDLGDMDNCVDILHKHIFSVKAVKADNTKNNDTVLVIDCIRAIVNDISQDCDIWLDKEANERIYDLTDKIAEKTKKEKKDLLHFSQKQINDFYKNATKNFQRNSTSDITVPPLQKGTVKDTNIYITESEKISANLFFIREIFSLLASLYDEYQDLMNIFYEYLEINKNDYEVMINGGTINCRKILKKLEPYKYPASLFRSDSSSNMSMSTELKNAYDGYIIKEITLDELRSLLKLHLFYKMEPENIGLIIPTHALINDLFDELKKKKQKSSMS